MFRFCKPLPLLATTFVALTATSCIEAERDEGTPQLVAFEILQRDWSPVTVDSAVPVPTVSPMVSFNARFDHLLDFNLLVNVDAGTAIEGLAAMTVTPSPVPPPSLSTVYSPNGHHKFALAARRGPDPGFEIRGPSLAVQPSGLPSGATVTVALDTSKLRGKKGQPVVLPAGVPTSWTVVTAPFSVTGETSMKPFAVDHDFMISASNVADANFASKVTVSGSVDMVPVADLQVQVTAAKDSDTDFVVSPVGGAWPAGSVITVTVAADAADQFGIQLGTPAVVTFPVAAAP